MSLEDVRPVPKQQHAETPSSSANSISSQEASSSKGSATTIANNATAANADQLRAALKSNAGTVQVTEPALQLSTAVIGQHVDYDHTTAVLSSACYCALCHCTLLLMHKHTCTQASC